MKVSSVISNKILTLKTTGYAAAAALGLSVASGISKNKTFRKTHKPFAYTAGILTLLHIALAEYKKYKYSAKSKS